MRARCLMVVLIGNLDMAMDKDKEEEQIDQLYPKTSNKVIEGQPTRTVETETVGEIKNTAQEKEPPPEIGIEEPSQPDDDIIYPTLTERGNELPRRKSTARTLSISQLPPASPSSTIKTRDRPFDPLDAPVFTRSHYSIGTGVHRRPTVQEAASPWRHMENLLYEIRLYDDEDRARGEFPRQWPKHACTDRMW
jgi:hypothetical protein